MREIHSNIVAERSISPVDATADTVGQIHDMQGFEQLEFILAAGTLTGGGFTPLIEESDASDMTGATAVPDTNLLPKGTGQEAGQAFGATEDDEVHKIGCFGTKRYVRLTMVETGTVTVGLIAAIALKYRASQTPTPETS